MKRNLFFSLVISLYLFSCAQPSGNETQPSQTSATDSPRTLPGGISVTDPENPEEPSQSQSSTSAQVLLFNGIGTSVSDWKNLELIMSSMGVTYRLINSTALNAMTLATLQTYKMILIPGGNSNYINNGLTKATKIRVRQAVRDYGVSYLGICAGAFAAVGIDSLSNTTAYYGFGVAQGDYLTHYYPNGNVNLLAAVPKVTFADGTSRYLMWYDGPGTPEWTRGVVARYPGGRPAISQTWTGKGFVMVSGPHPEAPPSWQWDSGTDPDGLDYDIAKKLIQSTLNRQPLPVF